MVPVRLDLVPRVLELRPHVRDRFGTFLQQGQVVRQTLFFPIVGRADEVPRPPEFAADFDELLLARSERARYRSGSFGRACGFSYRGVEFDDQVPALGAHAVEKLVELPVELGRGRCRFSRRGETRRGGRCQVRSSDDILQSCKVVTGEKI